jgi:hypothetical protein
MWIVMFGAPLAVLATLGDNAGGTTFGGTPVCLFAAFMLFCVILRRAPRSFGKPILINGGLGLEPATSDDRPPSALRSRRL